MAVTIAVVATFTAGADVASGGHRSATKEIKVLSKTAKEHVAKDALPKGESKGDVIVGSSILRNAVAQFRRRKGVIVGRDQYEIVVETSNRAAIRVSVTLPGGTLTCRGKLLHNRTRQVLRAEQGTGRFAHATGTCEATPAPTNAYGANALNLYKLQIP